MTTREFIESKGMSRNRNVKVTNQLGRVLHRLRLDKLLEEYHQEQLKLLNIPPVIKCCKCGKSEGKGKTNQCDSCLMDGIT